MTSDSSSTHHEMPEQDADPRLSTETGIFFHDSENESVGTGPTPLGIAWFGIVITAACYPVLLGCGYMVYSLVVYGPVTLPKNVVGEVVSLLTIISVYGLVYGSIMNLLVFSNLIKFHGY